MMTQVLVPVVVAVIGALGSIIAAVIVELFKQRAKAKTRKVSWGFNVWLGAFSLLLLVGVVVFVSYILLLPTPRAQIVSPEDYNGKIAIPSDTKAVIDYKDIPGNRFVWVVVRVPSVRPMRLVYPQLINGIPTPVTGSGRFEISITLGTGTDVNLPYNIEVLLLDEVANQVFKNYSQTCLDTGTCNGLSFPSNGAEVLDFVTVIRK
jgi:hypothetical protein